MSLTIDSKYTSESMRFLDELLMNVVIEHFHPDEYIIRVGAKGKAMYFLVSGIVEIELPKRVQKDPPRLVAGSFFGEIALFFERKRTASVRAVTDVSVCVLSKEVCLASMSHYPSVYRQFLELGEERLRSDDSARKPKWMSRMSKKLGRMFAHKSSHPDRPALDDADKGAILSWLTADDQETFEDVLTDQFGTLLSVLVSVASSTEAESLVWPCICIFDSDKALLPLIQTLVNHEVRKTPRELALSLFRGNTLSTKVITAVLNASGSAFLQATLTSPIAYLRASVDSFDAITSYPHPITAHQLEWVLNAAQVEAELDPEKVAHMRARLGDPPAPHDVPHDSDNESSSDSSAASDGAEGAASDNVPPREQELLFLRKLAVVCGALMRVAQSVMSSVKQVPDLVKYLLKSLYAATQHKFPKECRTVTGSLFFLRFVCPALVSPDQFGLVAPDNPLAPPERKALVLLTKAVQKLANGALFGTQAAYMAALNGTLEALRSQWDLALSSLLAISGTMVSVARPLFPFSASDASELSLSINQSLVSVVPTTDARWLHGQDAETGQTGFFPTAMVEVHSELVFENGSQVFLPNPSIGGKTPVGVRPKPEALAFMKSFVLEKKDAINSWFEE